jgi:hypothetical protein
MSKLTRLQSVFNQLTTTDQESVLAFAEFLQTRTLQHASSTQTLPEPKFIPRPEQESIVSAIRRLSQIYYMLDKRTVLSETSELVTQHYLQGRELKSVIDNLEQVFSRHYENFVRDFNSS